MLSMSMSFLDRKPQNASLAFRNEARIPSPGLSAGPPATTPSPLPRFPSLATARASVCS